MASKQLDLLLADGATTIQQKIDALKVLKVVVKNLCDPAKASDPKFRQLKLDNPKVRSKILSCAAAVPLLQSLGFIETMCDEAGVDVLRIDESAIDATIMNNAMNEIVQSLSLLLDANNNSNDAKKPKLHHADSNFSTSSTASTVSSASSCGKLSEKQKARRMLEEKQRKEREFAKQQRKQNVALLKQDKYVRQNDENWTSGVSAACAKSGDSISTFRDKFGEN